MSKAPHMTLLLLALLLGVTDAGAQEAADTPPAPPAGGQRQRAKAAVIKAGDTIKVTLKEDDDVSFEGEIGSEGVIQVPYLGPFTIAGRTADAAEEALAQALKKDLYVEATVTVTILKKAPAFIYIYGAVKAPGKVALPGDRPMTLMQALAEVKGLSAWAAPEKAYLLRYHKKSGERNKLEVDLKKAFNDLQSKTNTVMQARDVVVVPSATGNNAVMSVDGTEVILTGQVKQPGLVRFAPGEQRTLIRALFKAGGFTRFAKRDRVKLIRYQDNKRKVTLVNAERIIDDGHLDEDVKLQPGDMIVVDEKRINF